MCYYTNTCATTLTHVLLHKDLYCYTRHTYIMVLYTRHTHILYTIVRPE